MLETPFSKLPGPLPRFRSRDYLPGCADAGAGEAMAVLDKVTIAYRGTRYELGRGRDYFGLWTVDAPRSQPLEWWPETQEGWSSAWARFSTLEEPDTITAAGGAAIRLA